MEHINRRKINYVLYSVNEDKSNHRGTGIIILKKLNSVFKRISNRVCTTTIKVKHNNLVAISAYVPEHVNSEKHSEIREEF